MSRIPDDQPNRPGEGGAEFGEKGVDVVDEDAGKSEEEKLEEAVEDLKSDPG